METYLMRFTLLLLVVFCAPTSSATQKTCDDISKSSDSVNIALIRRCLATQQTTKAIHFNASTGEYSKSRQDLQHRLINETIADVHCEEKPIALYTGGLPGSGKTTFLKAFFPDINEKNRFAIVNADDFKEKLPEYRAWNADLLHLESSDMARLLLAELTLNNQCQRNFVYDGTFRDFAFYEKLTKQALDHDYRIYVLYVKTPPHVATERILKRFKETGRFCSNVPNTETATRSLGNLKHFLECKLYTGVVVIDGVTQAVECISGENFMQLYGNTTTCENYFGLLNAME